MKENMIKQHNIPNNSKVKLPDGSMATFLKMDGMYAHWIDGDGNFAIGNFRWFVERDGYYEVYDKSE